MNKVTLILSVVMTVALALLILPGVFAMNRGNALRNIALWLAIFTGLALVYQNFGPGSPHPLFSYRMGTLIQSSRDSAAPSDKAWDDKSDDGKPAGNSGFTPPQE